MKLQNALNAFYYSTALCDLRLMNERFPGQNITYNSLLYLELIHSMQGKCTASALAERLYISKPGVTLKINELVQQGLVIKTPDPADKRRSFLSVNEEKVPQYRIYRKQDNAAVKRITEQFSEEDIEKFCKMLDIITEINYEETK